MLDDIFMRVLDMSITAGIVILVVLLLRLLLKRTPKVFSYALWAVVLFRLICPITLEAPTSIVPEVTSVAQRYALSEEPISVLGAGESAYQAVGDARNGGRVFSISELPKRRRLGRLDMLPRTGGVSGSCSASMCGWQVLRPC